METVTPMLRQYRQAKAENPDAILMFRLGDFYATFLDSQLHQHSLMRQDLRAWRPPATARRRRRNSTTA